jgi:hypothetical protein
MLQKILRYIPFTTLIILFLFICGSIYLVAYWNVFGIDISNLVNVWEIPKSFFMPFLLSLGISMIPLTAILLIRKQYIDDIDEWAKDKLTDEELEDIRKTREKEPRYIKFARFITNENVLLLTFSIMTPGAFLFGGAIFCVIWAFSISCLLSIKVGKLAIFHRLFPYRYVRYIILFILVFTPFVCAMLGRVKELAIYNNNESKYAIASTKNINMAIQPTFDSLRLKLLGFLGDKVIFNSLDNSSTFILNQSDIGIIQIVDSSKIKAK